MKKLIITSMVCLGLISSSVKLEAASCSGGTPAYVCGLQEFLKYAEDAFRNCCARSEIKTVDICGGDVETTIVVTRDGINSSCRQKVK